MNDHQNGYRANLENPESSARTVKAPRGLHRFFPDRGFQWTFLLLSGLILLFIVLPVAKMIIAANPSIIFQSLADSEITASIALTVYAALIATAIGFVLGVPLAYLLAKTSFPGKRLIEGLIDLPLVIPH
ncbi:MAG: hypothetical protein EHM72_19980, partial [Calditrichaeota bacterium]